MSDELAPCQKCGCADIGQGCDIGPMESQCYCVCAKCGVHGPGALSQEQARTAWNEKQEAVSAGPKAAFGRSQSGAFWLAIPNDSPKHNVSTDAERGDGDG